MRKIVEIPDNVMERLLMGKCVEGSLRLDKWTGKIIYRAYQRLSRLHAKDRLVKKLPWGWVKESLERIKVFGSFPKDYDTAQVMSMLDEHTKGAKDALIDRELDLIEFC